MSGTRPFGLQAAVAGMAMMAALMLARGAALAARDDYLAPNPASVDFGSEPLGVSGQQTLTLTNNGARMVAVAQVAALPEVFGASGSCGTLAPGASCALTLSFKPGRSGPAQGVLLVFVGDRDLDDFFPELVPLSGQGIEVMVQGTAWEGQLRQAPVAAVAVNPDGSDAQQLAVAATDANGNFALRIDHRRMASSGCANCHFLQSVPLAQRRAGTAAIASAALARAPVRVRVRGGTFASEQDGSRIANASVLSALIAAPGTAPSMAAAQLGAQAAAPAVTRVQVNPLTTFVDARARTMLTRRAAAAVRRGTTRAPRTTAAPQSDLTLMTANQAAVGEIEGLYALKADPVALAPDFTPAGIGTDAGNMGLVLGALAAEDQQLCPGGPGGLVQALAADIADGVFDGQDPAGNPIPYCNGPASGPSAVRRAAAAMPVLTLRVTAGTTDYRSAIPSYVFDGVAAAPLRAAAKKDPAVQKALTAMVAQAGAGVGNAAPPSINAFESPPPSMTTARLLHTATLLANGNVLIAGGLGDNSTPLSSTELYDAANNCFAGQQINPVCAAETAPTMNAARILATATGLNNGKVLIAGGVDNSDQAVGSTEIFDPAGNSFAAGPSMNAARAGAIATLLNDGRVLIAGGIDPNGSPLASTELYDPAANSFAAGPAMKEARLLAAAALLPSNEVLIAGGSADASVELYDPVNNCFAGVANTACAAETTPTMGAARSFPTATSLPNGNVLFVGGEIAPNPNTPADLYDAVNNCFAGESGTPCSGESAPLVNDSAINFAAAAALPNGNVLIFSDLSPTLPLYDAANNCFAGESGTACAAETAPANGDPGVELPTMTLLQNGLVLIAGGNSGGINTEPVATTALYAP